MEEEYVSHSGVKNQKWGVRRYQNPDGSLTAEGRAHYGVGPPREKKKESAGSKAKSVVSSAKKTMQASKEKRAEKKAEKDAVNKQQHHESMKRYVRNHPNKLFKHRFEFSDDELKTLVSQIDADAKIKDISDKATDRNWARIEKFSSHLGSVYKLGSNAKNLYNLAADVNNFMVDTDKMTGERWTKIGEKINDKDKNQD